MNEQRAFVEVKKSIDEELEKMKTLHPELYEHFKDSIIMDEESKTFLYSPKSDYRDNQA